MIIVECLQKSDVVKQNIQYIYSIELLNLIAVNRARENAWNPF